MKFPTLIFLTLIIFTAFSQKPKVNEYAAIDKKALQLPDSLTNTTSDISAYIKANFATDKDKARAIFIWLTSNIQYDIENMYALDFYEKEESKISKPLKTRKGICENYAALFTDICRKLGMKSFVVTGYTQQDGFADYIPHAWSAALIDSTWMLFDPTWGSGYVSDNRFVKKINNAYYKVSPAVLIKSHMPFDYLWQFLNYPVTNQEFYEGKTQPNNAKSFFSFKDSLKVYEQQSHIEQLKSTAYRVEKNGLKNSMIFDELRHLKLEIETDRKNKIINTYNSAVGDYNEGIHALNDFINYRNKQFVPKKTDPEIQQMIDNADNKLEEATIKLEQISGFDAEATSMIKQLAPSIDDASKQVAEQQRWLRLYFSKGKSGRKSMFYDRKVTWFGIPLN